MDTSQHRQQGLQTGRRGLRAAVRTKDGWAVRHAVITEDGWAVRHAVITEDGWAVRHAVITEDGWAVRHAVITKDGWAVRHAVITKDGWAVQHAVIMVTDTSGQQVVRADADADGIVSSGPPAPGVYTAVATAIGYVPAALTVIVTASGVAELGTVVLARQDGDDLSPPGPWTLDPAGTLHDRGDRPAPRAQHRTRAVPAVRRADRGRHDPGGLDGGRRHRRLLTGRWRWQ